MRWTLLSLHQMGLISNQKTLFSSRTSLFLHRSLTPCLCMPTCPSFHRARLALCRGLCTHVCVMRALPSMPCARGLFFHVNILGTSNVFKILPGGNTWPLFTLQEQIRRKDDRLLFRVGVWSNTPRTQVHTRTHTVFCSPHAKHCCSTILVAVVYSVNWFIIMN